MEETIEREIKLSFIDATSARAAVVAAGGALKGARRLQHDALLDTSAGLLREQGSVLRVRVENQRTTLTFKGPVRNSTMKLREEVETEVADAGALFTLFERLGFRVWFRYEKFREEFALHGSIVAVDETPVGTFVEIEGEEHAIALTARALGRAPSDYLLDTYRALQARACEERGLAFTDMVFAPPGASA